MWIKHDCMETSSLRLGCIAHGPHPAALQVQQIDCARDKFGNVVEGSPDNVQRLYYFWALQQEDSGFVGSDGKHYPPRWQLKEMLVRGMHKLL